MQLISKNATKIGKNRFFAFILFNSFNLTIILHRHIELRFDGAKVLPFRNVCKKLDGNYKRRKILTCNILRPDCDGNLQKNTENTMLLVPIPSGNHADFDRLYPVSLLFGLSIFRCCYAHKEALKLSCHGLNR